MMPLDCPKPPTSEGSNVENVPLVKLDERMETTLYVGLMWSPWLEYTLKSH